MKEHTTQTKAYQAHGTIARKNSSGAEAATLIPPNYGMSFVDRQTHNIKLQRKPCSGCEQENEKNVIQTKLMGQHHPGLQRKLQVGASNDRLEQEADHVADQVMANSNPIGTTSVLPNIQRFSEQSSESVSEAPASVEHVLSNSGRPLEPALQYDMEVRFGYDFSNVRVHTGNDAAQSARDINALAYTLGNDVVFGAGQFTPQSIEGKKLIAHELAHVIQQRDNISTKKIIHRWGLGEIVGGIGGAIIGGLVGGIPGAIVGGIGGASVVGGLTNSGSCSGQLNLPNPRHSSTNKYGYNQRDATILYGLNNAPDLVPATGFTRQNTGFCDYTKRWTDGLGLARLNALGGDCGRYARELVGLTGRTPDSYDTASRPGIGLTQASNLQPGEAFYIRPTGTGALGAIQKDILSPWNDSQTVRKYLTNFHVATVVARDNNTLITSEVNAAFPGHVTPWFAMYDGNQGFYSTYRQEYRRADGTDPGLWRM